MPKTDENLQVARDSKHRRRAMEYSKVEEVELNEKDRKTVSLFMERHCGQNYLGIIHTPSIVVFVDNRTEHRRYYQKSHPTSKISSEIAPFVEDYQRLQRNGVP